MRAGGRRAAGGGDRRLAAGRPGPASGRPGCVSVRPFRAPRPSTTSPTGIACSRIWPTADLLDLHPDELLSRARAVRDEAHGTRVTFSPKVFIPLTMLCRDKCGYCTFAKAPARLQSPLFEPG